MKPRSAGSCGAPQPGLAGLADAFAAAMPAAAAAVGGAFGPASIRFTFKVVSGSMMTRAYGLRATICAISSRSGSCWNFKPTTSTRSQLMKSSRSALSTVCRSATLTSPVSCTAGFFEPYCTFTSAFSRPLSSVMEVLFAIYGWMAVRSMLLGFTLRLNASGWGVTSPLSFRDPLSLILVSSATLSGRARSKLTPSTCSDSGASSTFAAGVVLRSSADMCASCKSNLARSNCHGVPDAAAAGAAGAAVSAGAGVGGGAGAGGAVASLSRLTEPSASSHVTTLRPLSDSDSTWACRFKRSSEVPLTRSCGMVIQSLSDCLGLTPRSETAILATSSFKSTASLRANL